MEMVVNGVSTRKMCYITEELCGREFAHLDQRHRRIEMTADSDPASLADVVRLADRIEPSVHLVLKTLRGLVGYVASEGCLMALLACALKALVAHRPKTSLRDPWELSAPLNPLR